MNVTHIEHMHHINCCYFSRSDWCHSHSTHLSYWELVFLYAKLTNVTHT